MKLNLKIFVILALLGMITARAESSPSNSLAISCAEFNQLGNIDVLRRQIRKDMKRIQILCERFRGESDLRSIEAIASLLRKNVERLNEIVGPKYSQADYLQARDWKLGPRSLALGQDPQASSQVKAARVIRVFNWSNEQEEPLDRVSLEVKPRQIIVHLQRPASLAELCQFEQTIMVTIEFDIEGPHNSKTLRRNLLTQALGDS